MNNDPSAGLVQHAPILKLNLVLLWDILGRCNYLYEVRHLSQVCRMWREFLLESPSIWAKSIDLHALNQSSDYWRNLVLKRTGKAMLSVRAGQPSVLPKTHALEFLVYLLDEHWARIRHLDITLSLQALDDKRIWKALGRPAPNLQTFSCSLLPVPYCSYQWSLVLNLPPNFRLFSNHAPSLAKLLLPHFPPISLDITKPTLFSSNMRNLTITWPLVLTDTDLLTACMQMPHIEELALSHLSGLSGVLHPKYTQFVHKFQD